MRVVVIGTSGAGKTAMSEQIARRFGVQLVELDALNWRRDSQTPSQTDPARFLSEVDDATSGPGWVVAENDTMARHIVWARATHLVWLDYSKAAVMGRLLRRSFSRAWRRELIGGGSRGGFQLWLSPSHPIQLAWRTWQLNRTATARRLAEAGSAHLRVIQVIRPRDAYKVFDRLEPKHP